MKAIGNIIIIQKAITDLLTIQPWTGPKIIKTTEQGFTDKEPEEDETPFVVIDYEKPPIDVFEFTISETSVVQVSEGVISASTQKTE